jgi:hypothetical protein
MKHVKLVDALPTLFGVIALVGFVIFTMFNPSAHPGPEGTLGPMLLFGSGAISLITGIASVVIAARNKTLSKAQTVNIGWVLLIGAFFAWIVAVGLRFSVGP